MRQTSFPNKNYLAMLLRHLRAKVRRYATTEEEIVMLSGAALNWIGDFVSDTSIRWKKETLNVDDLYLTGTGPDWNRVVIDRCKRSPKKLRELMQMDAKMKKLFQRARFTQAPILVRYDDKRYKVLDGMHRTIAAIRSGRTTLQAYVAYTPKRPRPQCEPHVVYDLLRAYDRGIYRNKQQLLSALQYLRKAYANVDELLRVRFRGTWSPNKELAAIVTQALKKK